MPGTRSLAGLLLIVALVAILFPLGASQPGRGSSDAPPASQEKVLAEAKGTFAWDLALALNAPISASGSADAGLLGAESGEMTFEVPAGATAIRLVAEWGCLTPACEARVDLIPPGGDSQSVGPATSRTYPEPAASGQGTGKVTVQTLSPAPGRWTVLVTAVSPSAGADGTLHAVVLG